MRPPTVLTLTLPYEQVPVVRGLWICIVATCCMFIGSLALYADEPVLLVESLMIQRENADSPCRVELSLVISNQMDVAVWLLPTQYRAGCIMTFKDGESFEWKFRHPEGLAYCSVLTGYREMSDSRICLRPGTVLPLNVTGASTNTPQEGLVAVRVYYSTFAPSFGTNRVSAYTGLLWSKDIYSKAEWKFDQTGNECMTIFPQRCQPMNFRIPNDSTNSTPKCYLLPSELIP